MSDPRVEVVYPLLRDLHGRRGTLRGAERVACNGHDLGVLFDVELDGLGAFWLPREAVRLLAEVSALDLF